MRLLPGIVLASAFLVGCGPAEGPDPRPHPDVLSADADVRLVDEAEADLVLWISNQSFDDPEVHLTVAVDGVMVVDDDFHVEGQHNWVDFPLALEPGEHEITAESDSGASLRESFEVPGGKSRYAIIDHWTEDGSADLTWQFSRRPVAFG